MLRLYYCILPPGNDIELLRKLLEDYMQQLMLIADPEVVSAFSFIGLQALLMS